MPNKKEIRKLVEQIKSWPGWRVEETKDGWMAYPPNKEQSGVLIHRTPSDHRAWANTVARLRQRGGLL